MQHNYVMTLIAGKPDDQPLSAALAGFVRDMLDQHAVSGGDPAVLCDRVALDIPLVQMPDIALFHTIRDKMDEHAVDVMVQPLASRRKKLLLADMDSTIVVQETLDELAARAGIGEQVADITRRAMNGEIYFEEALRQRVGVLKDLPLSVIEETIAATTIMAGAQTLVATMKKHGAHCVLISGGFTQFTGHIAGLLGFDDHYGNVLMTDGDHLTGQVGMPILGKAAKLATLRDYVEDMRLSPDETVAIGDGANDIDMLQNAGLGVGFHPRPKVAAEVQNLVKHGDLTAVLYAQGYHRDMFV